MSFPSNDFIEGNIDIAFLHMLEEYGLYEHIGYIEVGFSQGGVLNAVVLGIGKHESLAE